MASEKEDDILMNRAQFYLQLMEPFIQEYASPVMISELIPILF